MFGAVWPCLILVKNSIGRYPCPFNYGMLVWGCQARVETTHREAISLKIKALVIYYTAKQNHSWSEFLSDKEFEKTFAFLVNLLNKRCCFFRGVPPPPPGHIAIYRGVKIKWKPQQTFDVSTFAKNTVFRLTPPNNKVRVALKRNKLEAK